ncbi:MAG TPA: MBL fold metallo-hydrolase [Thermoplasmata archaeon]|nr:MBL fold metallo-hydrolase [Thermoplasmata archaeon]
MASDHLRRVADQVYRLEDRFVNLYLIDLGKIVLVDTGTRKAEDLIRQGLRELGKEVDDIAALLLTHHHADHVGTAGVWRREAGAAAELHRLDAPVAAKRERRRTHGTRPAMKVAAAFMGVITLFIRADPFEADRVLEGGETLDVLGWPIEVIHAPGHTLGSCAFYARSADILFAGDAVNGRRGKPEPPNLVEDAAAAVNSFRRLTDLKAGVLLPGHGSPVRTPSAGPEPGADARDEGP